MIKREIPDDEVVAENAYVHIERMNDNQIWLMIDDQRYWITANDKREIIFFKEGGWDDEL